MFFIHVTSTQKKDAHFSPERNAHAGADEVRVWAPSFLFLQPFLSGVSILNRSLFVFKAPHLTFTMTILNSQRLLCFGLTSAPTDKHCWATFHFSLSLASTFCRLSFLLVCILILLFLMSSLAAALAVLSSTSGANGL